MRDDVDCMKARMDEHDGELDRHGEELHQTRERVDRHDDELHRARKRADRHDEELHLAKKRADGHDEDSDRRREHVNQGIL